MRVPVVRPAAKELTYQLYSRALHPELFDVCATRIIEQAGYSLVLRICESGHLVEIRRNGEVTVEINVDAAREVPTRGRCLSTRLGSGRDVEAHPLPEVFFQASIQLETLEPEVFVRLTTEFHSDVRNAALAHVFSSRNRLRPEAVSLLFADCGPKSVSIQAFHSFPDDLAIVRIQSLYEFGAS